MNNVTSKLAISNLNFEEIKPSFIFKAFESFVGAGISKICIYETSNGDQYGIAYFNTVEDAMTVYKTAEGLEIENTGSVFDLSFVLDDFIPDELIDTCDGTRKIGKIETNKRKSKFDENMIEISDCVVDFDIPEEFKSKPEDVVPIKSEKKTKKKTDDTNNEIAEALNEKETQKEDDFEFNITDERFKDLFENDDFIIDASNKKALQQRSTRKILEEKRKRAFAD